MSAALSGKGRRADLESGVRGGPSVVLQGCRCTALEINGDATKNKCQRTLTPDATTLPCHTCSALGALGAAVRVRPKTLP